MIQGDCVHSAIEGDIEAVYPEKLHRKMTPREWIVSGGLSPSLDGKNMLTQYHLI